jgi:phospholipase/carboxylesterase
MKKLAQKSLDGPMIAPLSGKAKEMVIILHGYGANGDDLISLAEEWAPELPDAVFLAPNAPDMCEASSFGFQWFSIRAIDERAFEREAQIGLVAPVLSAYIDEQLEKWDVPESRLVVGGFSQGAMMAMYTMPRRKNPCAGVIGYSGMLIDAEGLKAPEIVKMPVLAIHGDSDTVVPPRALAAVESGFSAAGFNVETALRPNLAHGIDHFGLIRGLQFIKEALGN